MGNHSIAARVSVCFLTLFIYSTLRVESAPPQHSKPLAKSLAGSSVSPDRLKKVIADSESRLGNLTPWQKKLFDEEVLTQPQRFVKDYRASSKGIDADIDWTSIGNYLRFYGPQVVKNSGATSVQPSLWYWVGAEPGCLKCAQALPAVKKMVKSRVENRGFRALDGAAPVNAKVTEASTEIDGIPEGESVNENVKIAALQVKVKKAFEIPGRLARETSLKEISEHWSTTKGASGVLHVYLQLAPQDDVDSVHAEEKRYLALMHFSTSAERVNGVYGFNSEFESLENDPLDQSVLRLYLDAMTDLGTQTAKQSAKLSNRTTESEASHDDATSLSLRISAVQSYGHYFRAKTEIQSALQGLPLKIREREFSRGYAVWILQSTDTEKSLSDLQEEVKKRVGGIAKERLKVSTVKSGENGISVELGQGK